MSNTLPTYRSLIDLTSETLIERTKCYRYLVITFAIITLVSVCAIIVTMSWRPSTLLLFLFPAYSFFLVCDNRKLNKWRTQIIEAWKSKAIDLNALRQAITANKAVPQQILQGMLETLPDAGDLVKEQTVSVSIRKALANAYIACDDNLRSKLICRAILHTIIAATIISAVFVKTWIPLSALAIAPMLLIMCNWLGRKRISKAIDKVTIYRESKDFNHAEYIEIAETVNWQGVSPRDKQRLFISGGDT